MSKRSEFLNSILTAGRHAGGSRLTIRARDLTLREFADWAYSHGYQLRDVGSIHVRHVVQWLASQSDLGIRTRQNRMAHLRAAIKNAGRPVFAASDELGNEVLGLVGGSRRGTHIAPSDEQFAEMLAVVDRRDSAVGVCLRLMDGLGLRRQEAVMADWWTLLDWQRALEHGDHPSVVRGTKGGRKRLTDPHARQVALGAIAYALAFLRRDRRRTHLIGGSLKQAVNRFKNVLYACGMRGPYSSHCLRYRWAQRDVDTQVDQGRSRKQSLRTTAKSLGHGQGRDRWVKLVYYREAAKPTAAHEDSGDAPWAAKANAAEGGDKEA